MEKVVSTISNLSSKVFELSQLDKVNSILQVDKVNSSVNDAEGNVNIWLGMIYDLAALIFVACAVYNFIQPFTDNILEGADGKQSAGYVISAIIWLYAALPLTNVIRNAGASIKNSSNSIVVFMFKDFILANIKMIGQMLAIAALFTATCGLINWIADIPTSVAESSMDLGVVSWMSEVPKAALMNFAEFLGFESAVSEIMGGMASWDLATAGEPQTLAGFIKVCYLFASAILILINVYIAIAIYSVLFGLAEAFMNWVKNPYLPMKSL